MRAVALLTLVLVLGPIASASAGVAEVVRYTDPRFGIPYSQISYTAAPGERNTIVVAHTGPDTWEFGDGAAPVVARAGCVLTGTHSASCRAPPTAPAGRLTNPVVVAAGDLADTVTAPPAIEAVIEGGSGDDVLRGNGSLHGGPGNDRILAGRARKGDTNALIGGMGDDVLRGGSGSDYLVGGTETATRPRRPDPAGEGDDLLDGGGGRDTVAYEQRSGRVIVDLAAGRGGARGERDVLRHIENAVGGGGDDVLLGDGGANDLEGRAGGDRLVGRDGDDKLEGDADDDLMLGGRGDDKLIADTLGDRARGGPGNDTLRGLRLLFGALLAARLDSGAGADTIELNAAPRQLACGRGSDLLRLFTTGVLLLDRVTVDDCERVRLAAFTTTVAPRRQAGALVLPSRCSPTAETPCSGSLLLRLRRAGGGSTLLPAKRFRLMPGSRRTLRIALGAAGGRVLAGAPGAAIEVDLRTEDATEAELRARWRVRLAR